MYVLSPRTDNMPRPFSWGCSKNRNGSRIYEARSWGAVFHIYLWAPRLLCTPSSADTIDSPYSIDINTLWENRSSINLIEYPQEWKLASWEANKFYGFYEHDYRQFRFVRTPFLLFCLLEWQPLVHFWLDKFWSFLVWQTHFGLTKFSSY